MQTQKAVILSSWEDGSRARSQTRAKWFSTGEQALWAFEAGDPSQGDRLGAGIVEIALATDNQSNEALQHKGTKTKFPLCLNRDGTRSTAPGSRPFLLDLVGAAEDRNTEVHAFD